MGYSPGNLRLQRSCARQGQRPGAYGKAVRHQLHSCHEEARAFEGLSNHLLGGRITYCDCHHHHHLFIKRIADCDNDHPVCERATHCDCHHHHLFIKRIADCDNDHPVCERITHCDLNICLASGMKGA
eukprot:1159587-Pelagomonas_calceolata.AAC.2